ncbi:MAG: hypothetical protein ACKPKO_02805, partial [Candidatus Fonsibacter sp.]
MKGVIARSEKRLAAAQSALQLAQAEVCKENQALAQYKKDLEDCEARIAADLAAGASAAHPSFTSVTKESIDQIASGAMQVLSSTQSAVDSGTPIDPQTMISCITQLCTAIHGLQDYIGGQTRTKISTPTSQPIAMSCKRRAAGPSERNG